MPAAGPCRPQAPDGMCKSVAQGPKRALRASTGAEEPKERTNEKMVVEESAAAVLDAHGPHPARDASALAVAPTVDPTRESGGVKDTDLERSPNVTRNVAISQDETFLPSFFRFLNACNCRKCHDDQGTLRS